MKLKAPFQYFGGKSQVAADVWRRLGNPKVYIEPFFGSGAVLLLRPNPGRIEVVNDLDCYIANFWRAVQADPDEIARLVDWPVNETDMEARQKWIVEASRKLKHQEAMRDNPNYYDSKIAAWWCWGLSAWIGKGWCTGEWHGRGHPSTRGHGVKIRDMAWGGALPQHGSTGEGVHRLTVDLVKWMRALQTRFRRVQICCGDWTRVMNLSIYEKELGIFLDPPYGIKDRTDCYALESRTVAGDVLEWCVKHGHLPTLRIALCGYEGEHEKLEGLGWSVQAWKAHGGMGNVGKGEYTNKYRERIWFSPHCLKGSLFDVFKADV